MGQLPCGTVTLLFTDIEGSTRLLHHLGDPPDRSLATHRVASRVARLPTILSKSSGKVASSLGLCPTGKRETRWTPFTTVRSAASVQWIAATRLRVILSR